VSVGKERYSYVVFEREPNKPVNHLNYFLVHLNMHLIRINIEIKTIVYFKKETKSWPRIVQPVLTGHHRAICRLCCSDGQLKEVVITKANHEKY